jgi:cell division protein FtsB
MNIQLKQIRLDGNTQPRVQLNEEVVAEYTESINQGAEFPPVTVFHDGSDYWLADGFHRYFAHKRAAKTEIEADVRTGTLRDATLHSVGANGQHGLRRTNEDKRRAVMILLNDIEWSEWSDSEIARRCEVSHQTVARVKNSLQVESKPERKFVNKHGTESVMKVDKINKREEFEKEDPIVEMATEIETLSQENTQLREKIALGTMDLSDDEKLDIEEQLAQYKQRINVLEAEHEAMRRSRDSLLNEKAELVKQVMYWKKRAEKSEKQAA